MSACESKLASRSSRKVTGSGAVWQALNRDGTGRGVGGRITNYNFIIRCKRLLLLCIIICLLITIISSAVEKFIRWFVCSSTEVM